jgi:hypothetical protein
MDLKDLVPDPANRRTHGARNLEMVVDALKHVGAARSEAAAQAGIPDAAK